MTETGRIRRILVTVDAGNHRWQEAIRYAANLAKSMDAELHTLFVEDDNVATAAELPFTVEISIHRAQRQSFSPEDVSRVQRQIMERMRAVFENTLRETQLQGEFATARRQQLPESCHRGDIFWLHSRSEIARLPLRTPTLRKTLYLLYTDTEADENLLPITRHLLQEDYRGLVVFNVSDTGNDEIEAHFADIAKPVECVPFAPDTDLDVLMMHIENRAANTLLLPGNSTIADDWENLLRIAAGFRFEVLLVK